MSAGPLVIEVICTCCLAAFLLHRYGDLRKQNILTTLTTFIAWYFSFLIIFVLPLDVSSTFYRQCFKDKATKILTTTPKSSNITTTADRNTSTTPASSTPALQIFSQVHDSPCEIPLSHVPENVLPTLWQVVYWTSQLLTWIILPLMQSYSTAGDFTVAGKIKTALIENAIYYGSYLLIFGVCLIYVVAKADLQVDAERLKVIGITASNTWGLFLLILLLGYGLVEVPRSVYNSCKKGFVLSKTYFKISKLSTDKTEADEALEDVLDEIKKVSEKIKYNHPLRKHVDTILLKCPETMRHSVKQNNDDYEDYNRSSVDIPNEKTLVRLHKRVIRDSQNHHRTHAQWNSLMQKAIDLEDVEKNEQSATRKFQRSQHSTSALPAFVRIVYTPLVEWYWRCKVYFWLMRVCGILLAIVTFMVVWSECLFFVKDPVLSLFAIFINAAKHNYDYVFIELSSILIIAYLCFCAYYSVFQIRILNLYYIAPHHQTDEFSLMFTGMMLCRLTPPMCLNFLGLIHLDSHITKEDNLEETSYTQIMGHMDVISFISDGFNIYFPMILVLLCICTFFSLGSRILHFLGVQQFIGDDDMTQELVDEGRQIVQREKRSRDRKHDSAERRREWTERFGTTSQSSDRIIGSRADRERERETLARSPDDNDKTELLKEAEPIDYTGELPSTTDPFSDFSQGYQRTSSLRSSRFSSKTSSAPPRGIFDDV
ncbi:G-protein coupled receptor-associated protein LMBRD2-like [Saccostrea echinata]|uniref:G-protein coupled receptor-associated protein LMBRD2-like n=1 Tax=Saccostrea echinata TaxID=191078 RepID=UPI002A7F9A52|nr:G-protein coupled receptor-associated protein LMBRD2-like [Saccostrea echinata]